MRFTVFPALRGVALIKTLLEELELKPIALLPIFKTEAIIAAVLSGQRRISVEPIEGLSRSLRELWFRLETRFAHNRSVHGCRQGRAAFTLSSIIDKHR